MNKRKFAVAVAFALAGCDDAKLGSFESEGEGEVGAMVASESSDDGDDNSDPSDDGADDAPMVLPGDCPSLAANYDVITEGLRMTLLNDGRMSFAIEIDELTQPPRSECKDVCDDHTYYYFEIQPEDQRELIHVGPMSGRGWDYRGNPGPDTCDCTQQSGVDYDATFYFVQIDPQLTCGLFQVDGWQHAFSGTREPFD